MVHAKGGSVEIKQKKLEEMEEECERLGCYVETEMDAQIMVSLLEEPAKRLGRKIAQRVQRVRRLR